QPSPAFLFGSKRARSLGFVKIHLSVTGFHSRYEVFLTEHQLTACTLFTVVCRASLDWPSPRGLPLTPASEAGCG
ncbi:hypothetical protein CSUI_008481, partial [Cystoisospora suis]